MKRVLALLLAVMLVASLAIGCTKPAEETETADITIGLVTDVGGIDDKSFNQGTWEGIVRFAEEMNVAEGDYKFVQSATDADYVTNLSTFADDELDIIIAPGFLFGDAMTEVATAYPEQKFLIIDMVVDLPNVASAVFAEHEGSFLVGVAAALKAQDAGKDTVGFIGGMDFDLIQKFEAGFEAGVAAVDPNMTVLIEYAGDFANPPIGQTLAAKMYDEGAYVIYHAAGGTGNGLIKEAKDRVANGEDVWAIGVDKDQYADGIYEGEKSVILTSMMKRVDTAAYKVSEQVVNDAFKGGVMVFSLANDGVGIPAENPNLTDAWVSTINEFASKVKAGEIEVPTLPNRLK
ncbi:MULTISPECIES: BMP family protein [unclassified Fusibacter]|uniref:BMP family lipoprotein n=1 Tax=unclassified Fusibacter TaxID=2624464 RepID=UPI00101263BF|nr:MULTISPECIES: BMP family ABC transporter substrate-binding protein [unclassified Fusibacter]MCK8059751.1 BMP family ABC transporter substrate-binding protein [Fusibacter sp. A2]NPE21552.1 BMP family ABC transporter substrate-binding protein [Fusibacter sp. A1]RXV61960.1 BMP family ABC transporter substrate-binding protein [Fusibacter sp. A1]